MTQTVPDVRARYQEALEALTEKLQRDPYILAAILFGSLSYDAVWEKSDIDLFLVGRDEKKPIRDFCLVENGINIHAILYPRSKFKQQLEKDLRGSFFNSSFARGTLLFSRDETINEYFDDAMRLGGRDRELGMMRAAQNVLGVLTKAEKWLYVKRDPTYSFLYVMYAVSSLATIEVLLHHEIPGREVLQRALQHNPEFFEEAYVRLVHGEKSEATIERALLRLNGYLDEKIDLLFSPILEYLAEAGGIRTTHEIDEYFRKSAQTEGIGIACEWLADRGIIQKVPSPVRLNEKSPVTVDEAAYYYDKGVSDHA